MRLTDLSIKRLAPPSSGQKTHFDDMLKNFGVRISQGGTKSFIVLVGKSRKRQTIGTYPAISLADARKEAKKLLSEEPSAETVARPALLFIEAKERFLADAASRGRAKTVYEYQRLLNRHFQYAKPVTAITRHEIMHVVEKLRQRAPAEAKAAFVAMRTLMNWCVKQGFLDASPMPALAMKTTTREHVLTPAEIALVLRATTTYPYPFGPIVRLLLLTGQRRGEVASLQWDWINTRDRTITLPATVTKNGRTHTFPYGDLVAETLAALPNLGDKLFPSRTESGDVFNGWSKSKKAFDSRLMGVQPYTLHDLRRTFASTLAGLGTPIHVTEKLLNHASGSISGVAAVYNRHSYMEEMCEAITAYGAHLDQLRRGNKSK